MRIVEERTVRIRTTEGVEFGLRLANPIRRFAALGLDLLLSIAFMIASLSLLGNILQFMPGLQRALNILLMFFALFGYFFLLEWRMRGQTIGKRAMNIRVVDIQGLDLQVGQVLMRTIFRVLDMLPLFYGLGGVICLFSRYQQRLGDLVANTVVVHLDRLTPPDTAQIMAGKFNSFREAPHLVQRCRSRFNPAESQLALEAILRRDDFDDVERVRLFKELAEFMRERFTFPESLQWGLSDEQVVRNYVDILFRES